MVPSAERRRRLRRHAPRSATINQPFPDKANFGDAVARKLDFGMVTNAVTRRPSLTTPPKATPPCDAHCDHQSPVPDKVIFSCGDAAKNARQKTFIPAFRLMVAHVARSNDECLRTRTAELARTHHCARHVDSICLSAFVATSAFLDECRVARGVLSVVVDADIFASGCRALLCCISRGGGAWDGQFEQCAAPVCGNSDDE
jgi:hypothetical protein